MPCRRLKQCVFLQVQLGTSQFQGARLSLRPAPVAQPFKAGVQPIVAGKQLQGKVISTTMQKTGEPRGAQHRAPPLRWWAPGHRGQLRCGGCMPCATGRQPSEGSASPTYTAGRLPQGPTARPCPPALPQRWWRWRPTPCTRGTRSAAGRSRSSRWGWQPLAQADEEGRSGGGKGKEDGAGRRGHRAAQLEAGCGGPGRTRRPLRHKATPPPPACAGARRGGAVPGGRHGDHPALPANEQEQDVCGRLGGQAAGVGAR